MSEEFLHRPLSLSGVPLAGNRIVRTIYLDESGTSLTTPVAVVCGVIIDADRQWEPIEIYLKELVKEFVPPELRHNFVFHATELFHGCFGKNKDHPKAAREALQRIIEIPLSFGLPVAFGFHFKSDESTEPDSRPSLKPQHLIAMHHSLAYCLCAYGCEKYMQEHGAMDEIATMVAENTHDSKKQVKRMHSILQGKHEHSDFFHRALSRDRKYLPIRKIKDTVHFAEKQEALFLQLADAFGYVFRGFLEGRRNADSLINGLLYNPGDLIKFRTMKAACHLLIPQLIPEPINPALILPRTWSTIPGHGEVLP